MSGFPLSSGDCTETSCSEACLIREDNTSEIEGLDGIMVGVESEIVTIVLGTSTIVTGSKDEDSCMTLCVCVSVCVWGGGG